MGVLDKLRRVEALWELKYEEATDDEGNCLEFQCRPLVHADLAAINVPGHGGIPIVSQGRDMDKEPLSQDEQQHFILYMSELVKRAVVAMKDSEKGWVKIEWSEKEVTPSWSSDDPKVLIMHINSLQRLAGMKAVIDIGGRIIRHANFGGRMEPFAAQGFRQEGLPNGGETGEGIREATPRDNVAN